MKLPKGVTVWTGKGAFTGEVPDHLVPKKLKEKLENKSDKKPENKPDKKNK